MESKKIAVIQIKSMQYLVKEGQALEIDRFDAEPGSKVKFDEVLLKIDGDKVEVGTPIVAESSVDAEVVAHIQGEKIRSFTYKSKSRERRVKGARAKLTTIRINKIN